MPARRPFSYAVYGVRVRSALDREIRRLLAHGAYGTFDQRTLDGGGVLSLAWRDIDEWDYLIVVRRDNATRLGIDAKAKD